MWRYGYTQEKYKYLKFILRESAWVNVLGDIPPLIATVFYCIVIHYLFMQQPPLKCLYNAYKVR